MKATSVKSGNGAARRESIPERRVGATMMLGAMKGAKERRCRCDQSEGRMKCAKGEKDRTYNVAERGVL